MDYKLRAEQWHDSHNIAWYVLEQIQEWAGWGIAVHSLIYFYLILCFNNEFVWQSRSRLPIALGFFISISANGHMPDLPNVCFQFLLPQLIANGHWGMKAFFFQLGIAECCRESDGMLMLLLMQHLKNQGHLLWKKVMKPWPANKDRNGVAVFLEGMIFVGLDR